MEKIKYVCIFSLRWSGSTFFNMLLGQHKKVVSVGEVNVAFKHMNLDKICSCNKPARDCDFWGPVYGSLLSKSKTELNRRIKYDSVITSINQVFGQETVVCDSGKDAKAILELADNPNIELYVIYLSKDIRGFVESNLSSVIEKNKIIYVAKYIKTLFYQTLYWLYFNRKYTALIEGKGIKMMKIGYEELCLNTNYILNKTCDFLGIERVVPGDKIDNSKNHILWGNSMRYDPLANSSVQYDFRWNMNVWVSLISWPLQFFNKKYAYPNTVLNAKGKIERKN